MAFHPNTREWAKETQKLDFSVAQYYKPALETIEKNLPMNLGQNHQ